MVKPLATPFGHPLPPALDNDDNDISHAITVHVPGWETIGKVASGDPETFTKLKAIYPRFGVFFATRNVSNCSSIRVGLFGDSLVVILLNV